ncbi:MAG TPA: universal stress protein [Candidatus Binatia bacterium]|nr:universal stress protein [Candidatus Binatia bacterium]
MYEAMLVPLDGSKTAEKVLPYARYLAGKFKVPVELLAVVDVVEIASHMTSEKVHFLDTIIEDAVQHSTTYLRGVATTIAGTNVRCSVEKGRAEDTIIEKAATDKTMLITMATHGRSGLNRFLLGSIAEKVLRGTVNPLLLIRAGDEKSQGEAMLKSIIVPLDGSELAEAVLPIVADMAKKLDLEIELFRTYHVPYNVYSGDEGLYAVNYEELLAGLRDEAAEYLEKKAADLKRLGVAKVQCITKEGLAADEIISLGRKTPDNLIAMSSHGRSGVRRWVLGSVTELVVRHSGDPVLVIRSV